MRQFQRANKCDVDGEVGPQTIAALTAALTAAVDKPRLVRITGGNCYVRKAPTVAADNILGVLYEGTTLDWLGEADDGWLLVDYNGQKGWVSGKYGKLVK